jgi:hypothetical protein
MAFGLIFGLLQAHGESELTEGNKSYTPYELTKILDCRAKILYDDM